MNENFVWIRKGNSYTQSPSGISVNPDIPTKIFTIYTDMTGFHLMEYQDTFNFDFKIYDVDNGFIDHVLKTFNNTTSNLGILLNGTKGTGKTVSGKLIANAMNLPVILVQERTDGLIDFLSKINFPCIFFFDEYEKNFGDSSEILSLMDGVYNSDSRKIFILTTNQTYINENMKSRPSRIRYVKNFGNLSLEAINAYIDDNLNDKSYKDTIVNFIDSLEISTIDILKAIVDEINIHNCDIDTFKDFFNVSTNTYYYEYIGYTVRRNEKFTLSEFKELESKLGTSGKSRYGDQEESLDADDLGMYEDTFRSSRPIIGIIPGDKLMRGTVIFKEGEYLVVDEGLRKNFIHILNPGYTNSLYNPYNLL